MAAFAANANPYYTLAQKLWGTGWWLVFFAIINSTFAIGIASTNATTRVTYTMAQAGILPSALKTIHPVYQTPTVAIHVQETFQILSFLVVGMFFGASQIFGFLGTITTLAIIVLYVLANFALTAFIRHEQPTDFDVWRHGIMPVVGTLLLIPVIFVTIWPIPPYPLNLTPYLFVILMIIGFLVMKVVEAYRPGALARDSSTLTSTVEEAEPQVG
jgi:amino acid transporter